MARTRYYQLYVTYQWLKRLSWNSFIVSRTYRQGFPTIYIEIDEFAHFNDIQSNNKKSTHTHRKSVDFYLGTLSLSITSCRRKNSYRILLFAVDGYRERKKVLHLHFNTGVNQWNSFNSISVFCYFIASRLFRIDRIESIVWVCVCVCEGERVCVCLAFLLKLYLWPG